MANIIIYSTQVCPYCVRAKELLKGKGVNYTEIDVSSDDNLRLQMMQKAGGRRTVPQIFINDEHIGGFDDLAALDRAGGLDAKLR
jgi:glutaredoxin 3